MNWNALFTTTLRLYQKAALDTVVRVQRNWWIALLPFLYGLILFVAGLIFSPFGMAGGLIMGLVTAICTSSYLYFLAGAVNGSRMYLHELPESWRPYFSPVITILFFFFLIQFTLNVMRAPFEAAMLINLILLVVLNPIPEIIYQGRSDGLDMLQESVEFLRENAIEWFLPLIVLVLLSFILPIPLLSAVLSSGTLGASTFGSIEAFLYGSVSGIVLALFSAFILFVIMVFRGLLFATLSTSTRRQRVYRSRFS
jgi:hypothetical protein